VSDQDRARFNGAPSEFRMITGYGAHWGGPGHDGCRELGFGGVLNHLPHEGYLRGNGALRIEVPLLETLEIVEVEF
jgi:hypothetical protein